MNTPDISIVIPTLNSEKTLAKTLRSVRGQSIPQNRIEILVVDGGSSDDTIEIAQSFGCIIVRNEKKLPEFAKHIGIQKARGTYCVFLDSDEELLNIHSLERKYTILQSNPEVKNVLIGGLKNPADYPFINEYASRVGDPFSYFMYGVDADDYLTSLDNRFKRKEIKEDYTIFHIGTEIPPICDGGGHFFDLSYLKKHLDVSDPHIVSRIFDEMTARTRTFAAFRNDFILHYSNTQFTNYVNKVYWRIVNNMHYVNVGITGFSGRQHSMPYWFQLKKLLFIPLSLILIWPLYSSIVLVAQTKNLRYFIHTPIAFYTAWTICIQFIRKILRTPPPITTYGKI
jgi:glycosyltransferase involved in cell wall biosynthesis